MPNQTFWAKIDVDSTLTIGDVSLYHLDIAYYQLNVEMSTFFEKQTFSVDLETENQISMQNTRCDLNALENVMRTTAVIEEDIPIRARSSNTVFEFVMLSLVAFLYVIAICFACVAWKLYNIQRQDTVILQGGRQRLPNGGEM